MNVITNLKNGSVVDRILLQDGNDCMLVELICDPEKNSLACGVKCLKLRKPLTMKFTIPINY